MQPAAAGPLGDQRPFILGDGPTDLEQKLVVWVLGHRPVEELDAAAVPLQLLEEENLVDVVAGQPVGVGDEDAVVPGQGGLVPQPVQAGPPQGCAGVAVVPEDVLLRDLPTPAGGQLPQPIELLVDCLGLGLALGRDADVHGGTHRSPPSGSDGPALPAGGDIDHSSSSW